MEEVKDLIAGLEWEGAEVEVEEEEGLVVVVARYPNRVVRHCFEGDFYYCDEE